MTPIPKDLNPLSPIQRNWGEIKPVLDTYNEILSGMGTVFGFASAIALIAAHKFYPPKWPFTQGNWNPKPNVRGAQQEAEKPVEELVSEETIVEDELAEVAAGIGTLKRRSSDAVKSYNDSIIDRIAFIEGSRYLR
jgi:hypothetical protein